MRREGTIRAIGPLPPPLHGQSLATRRIISQLRAAGWRVLATDTAEGLRPGRIVRKTARGIRACAVLATSGRVATYLSVNANRGMWLTVALATIARLSGSSLVLHHHTYGHIVDPGPAWRALAKIGGSRATHVALSETMARDLSVSSARLPLRTAVLNNSGMVDPRLLEISTPPVGRVVLGMLSNLTVDKGIDEAVDLAIACFEVGIPAQLSLAGPIRDRGAADAVARAKLALGDALTLWGSVDGESKLDFFSELSHFVFPSTYTNEASPVVVFEALAAGVPVLALRAGSVPEIVGDSPHVGKVIGSRDRFVGEALEFLVQRGAAATRDAPRTRFGELFDQYATEFAELEKALGLFDRK